MTIQAIWALTAAAPRFDAVSREQIEGAFTARRPAALGCATLTTCHRVEVYGTGPVPTAGDLPRDGAGRAPEVLAGRAAVRHLCELATGLQSAVIGEQQILHQLRAVLRDERNAGLDPTLARTWHIALRAGRLARSGHGHGDRGEFGLGDLAALWLDRELNGMAGRRVLVAGTGVMGRALLRAVEARGALATVATRRPREAEGGRRILNLLEAADRVAEMDAVAVALSGPWVELSVRSALPIAVDLSFPTAVPTSLRARAARFADVDSLALARPTGGAVPDHDAYRARAERIVYESVAGFEAWSAARPSAATIRDLRARADAERDRALERLFRRLPDLDSRERRLVRAMAQQLVASVLHRPTAALGRDDDGSAAAAAERLFGP